MSAGRTSVTDNKEWGTPPEYVEAIRSFLGRICLDPCSNKHSVVKAEVEYRLPETDGLAQSWNYPTVFVNPPYGKDADRGTTIRDWLRKCAQTSASSLTEIIALIPVATNTRHWKESIFAHQATVCFLHCPRLKFLRYGEPDIKGAPMACALVYWGWRPHAFAVHFADFGTTVNVVSPNMSTQ